MLKILLKFKFVLLAILLPVAFFSCKKGEAIINLPLSGPNQEFYALANNSLLKFNSNNIKASASQVAVTGLSNPTEKLLSIDFRPATGELYAISDASKVYIINVISGIARLVTTTAFAPALTATSIDFDPTTDRITVITNSGQNLSISPETGEAINNANLSNTAINGLAYSNSVAGAKSTVLYYVDPIAKVLYKQDQSTTSALVKVGDMEVDLGTNVSFDISPNDKNAIAIGRDNKQANLYVIDLETGLAELKGRFSESLTIQSIAMPANPVAYAIDADHNLIIFNPTAKSLAVNKTTTGLQVGETILGMDMRPKNGQIYALGSTNRLYTLNTATGAFTQVGILTSLLNGTSFGFNFNPVADLIRVVSNTGQNLRINPITAAVTLDASISPATNTISAVAYSNNFIGANATKLYVIDFTSDKLYTQEPNTGVLTAVGDLKINIESANGFDILSTTTLNTAYGVFTVAGKTALYKVDLATGAAILQGELTTPITAFTLGLKF